MPSRRALLASAGALGLGLGVASQVHLGQIPATPPPEDTWPLTRYGPANTASNPTADVPSDPAVDWETPALMGSIETEIVVGPERIYATGEGVAAFDRSDGTVQWNHPGGGRLAYSNETLFVAPTDEGMRPQSAALRAIDAATGTQEWTDASVNEVTSVLVSGGSVFIGSEPELGAFDATSGRKQWSRDSPAEAIPVVHDGHLFAAGGLVPQSGRVTRHGRRSFLDVPLQSPPPIEWTVEYVGKPRSFASAGATLVTGFWQVESDTAGLMSLSPVDDEVRWEVVDPGDSAATLSVGPIAVASDRCLAGVDHNGHQVSCFQLEDGSEEWHVPTETAVTAVAVGDDVVLVGTESGAVQAFDLTTGRRQWGIDITTQVDAIAPVGETVFAATAGGRVFAIR